MDKHEIRKLAEASIEFGKRCGTEEWLTPEQMREDTPHDVDLEFIAKASPTTIIALLDDTAAKDAEIAELRENFEALAVWKNEIEARSVARKNDLRDMRPVVEAAVKWFKDHQSGGNVSDDDLWHTVRACEAKMKEVG